MVERESPSQQFNRLEKCRDMDRWWATYKQIVAEGGDPNGEQAQAYIKIIDSELDTFPYGAERPMPSLEVARSIAQASLKESARRIDQPTEEFNSISLAMLIEYDRKFKRGLL